MRDLFAPLSPEDIVGNHQALNRLTQLCNTPPHGAVYALVSGPSGCGKSSLCRMAMRNASVLDVEFHFSHHQHGQHSNPNVQMDPKQILTNFVRAKTLDQFLSRRATKVVWLDDINILCARDRLLASTLVGLSASPINCVFVMCGTTDQLGKVSDLLALAKDTHLHVFPVQYQPMFAYVLRVLQRERIQVDEDRVLRMCKACKGNWHDFNCTVERWMLEWQSDKPCIHNDRDILQSLSPREIVQRLLWTCTTVPQALELVDYECGDLYMLLYENWTGTIKHQMNKRPSTQRCRTTSAKGSLPGDVVMKHMLSVQDAFLSSLLLDNQANLDADWGIKNISTSFRLGKFVHELTPLRRTDCASSDESVRPSVTNILQRLCTGGGGRRHPKDVAMRRGMSGEDGSVWRVMTDCAIAGHTTEKLLQTYASAFSIKAD